MRRPDERGIALLLTLLVLTLLVALILEFDAEARREEILFAGDSPNDAPMFGYFPNAVGVANVLDFAARLRHKPRWVTRARGAAGFVELTEALLAAKAKE